MQTSPAPAPAPRAHAVRHLVRALGPGLAVAGGTRAAAALADGRAHLKLLTASDPGCRFPAPGRSLRPERRAVSSRYLNESTLCICLWRILSGSSRLTHPSSPGVLAPARPSKVRPIKVRPSSMLVYDLRGVADPHRRRAASRRDGRRRTSSCDSGLSEIYVALNFNPGSATRTRNRRSTESLSTVGVLCNIVCRTDKADARLVLGCS